MGFLKRVGGRFGLQVTLVSIVWLLGGCAHHMALPQERHQWVYQVPVTAKAPSLSWAPAFIVYGHSRKHNRIGRPTAVLDNNGHEEIFVDPQHPVFYVMERTFSSFYYKQGRLKGYVKGAAKPWETLLMSLISLDFWVGTDKAFSDSAGSDNPFYTSLKPWRRQDSNMWNFSRFLKYWGWSL